MSRPRLNRGQRVVIIVGLGIGLALFGQWLIGWWEFGSASFGWVAYAPLSNSSSPPVVILHPWVRLVIWLALTVIWVVVSAFLLRSRQGALDETGG